MRDLAGHLRRRGPFARRADLLRAGFTDADLRRALAAHRVFRVRHGWYALPGTPDAAVHAVRVGGRVTGVAALRSYGLFLPRPSTIDVVVPRNAARLRRPTDRRARLRAGDGVRIRWSDVPRGQRPSHDWRADPRDALAFVLRTGSRELAVAASDGVIRYLGWTLDEVAAVYRDAPARVRPWLELVDGRADAWGESWVRLRFRDAGIAFEPQAVVPGAGRLDGRIGPRTYVEVDGAQHEESWSSDDEDWYGRDRVRDAVVAALGGRVLRITYPMFAEHWPLFLEAARRSIAADVAELGIRGLAPHERVRAAGRAAALTKTKEKPGDTPDPRMPDPARRDRTPSFSSPPPPGTSRGGLSPPHGRRTSDGRPSGSSAAT